MPIHAVLGATGNLGSATLRDLLSSGIPDLTINILVRSKAKLLGAFPQLANFSRIGKGSTVNIFEGPISDEPALAACVRSASVIYVCVSTNHSAHTVDIARSTAAYLIAALSQRREAEGAEYQDPVILFNRSLTLSKEVQLPGPVFTKKFFHFVIALVYEDLERASLLYDAAEKEGLLARITVDAPMLVDGDGTVATGYKLIRSGTSSWYLSYADFGKAMVELGQRRGEFEGRAVGVSATGKVRTNWLPSLWIILLGLRYRLLPF
ncbi:hypothetical protein LTR56_025619 [Elasticomyces elasticus]|nr:hypothetical protein LTR56_025619 [Elasticomyces elasticus]KAK3627397.1 hypothetical protein LTR22_022781 [Elasticomyces elasticus]KAK4904433.1 hypothetical protein LTR49_026117 [Elasticomyces elasticus]KAK5739712.1 hypothetical protein LTS12_025188 [Elasticomyces elasticus]